MILQEIIDKYNLMNIVEDDGWCYAEIRKALYGLKEAAYISNVKLKRILAAEGYVPSKFTPGLFTHKTRDIAFALCTDDFGCRYCNKEDAEHLIETVSKRYPITVSWNPDYYLGMTLKWDYEKRTVECSMPGYVQEALLKFQHHYEGSRHSSPSPHAPIQYGQKIQMANIDESDPLTKTQVKLLQQVCGQFLYYARAVDATMLHALNDLATKVNNGTQETAKALTHFLNYCAANPDASII